MKVRIISLLFLFLTISIFSQETELIKEKLRVLFIYDCSNSMNARWQSGYKHEIAINLLSKLLDSLSKSNYDIELALRVYGHQTSLTYGQDCNDTKLEVPFSKQNAIKIKEKLQKITPKGTTPIALTLQKSAEDFTKCDNCTNIIILITDGLEECGGDPCAVSQQLQKKNIIIKPFVIGIGLDEKFKKTFACVGNFYDALNEQIFKNVLDVVIFQALNKTTTQVNLLDINGESTETNVNMTFYNVFDGKDKYNYVHTMNPRGVPDTLYIDPHTNYNIVVNTLPPVHKDSVKLRLGTHNIIAIEAPQGHLIIKRNGKKNFENPQILIRKKGGKEIIHVQNLDQIEKYLVGEYDLEVLTLPRMKIEGVKINQNHTTTVKIPVSGVVSISKNLSGFGSIYQIVDKKLIWVTNLKINSKNSKFNLLPGIYKIVFRPLKSTSTKFTQEQTFEIKSGESEFVKF